MKLALLKLQRASLIRDARFAHGTWAKWHKTSNMKQRRKWWNAFLTAQRKLEANAAAIEAKTKKVVQISALGTVALGEFEGGQSSDGLFHPYQDSGGVWTIGYGHTESVSGRSAPLTLHQAQALLHHDLNTKYAPEVAAYAATYGLGLNQKQFDALVSFCYNLGSGYFARGNNVGDEMAARNYLGIADAMLAYDHARIGGVLQVLPGLSRRRHWERQLFLNGTYSTS